MALSSSSPMNILNCRNLSWGFGVLGFCWFLYVQGGCVLGEVFSVEVGVSAPPISAATASV